MSTDWNRDKGGVGDHPGGDCNKESKRWPCCRAGWWWKRRWEKVGGAERIWGPTEGGIEEIRVKNDFRLLTWSTGRMKLAFINGQLVNSITGKTVSRTSFLGRSGVRFGHVPFSCPLDIQGGILKAYTGHESLVKVGLRGNECPGGPWAVELCTVCIPGSWSPAGLGCLGPGTHCYICRFLSSCWHFEISPSLPWARIYCFTLSSISMYLQLRRESSLV